MPLPIVYGMAIIKKSCAIYNKSIEKIDATVADAIVKAADEVVAGDLDEHFPRSPLDSSDMPSSNPSSVPSSTPSDNSEARPSSWRFQYDYYYQ